MTTLRLHPDNPSRFLWRGKAHFLLASTEHYGAVLNGQFDYERYLDTIAADGLSLTRIFAFFREHMESLGGELGAANTLAPEPASYVAPWERTPDSAAGVSFDGLPKFDLDRWNAGYFSRLRDFIAAAGSRGVVVELVFFSNQYNEQSWNFSPLHPANNVNGVGGGVGTYQEYLTLTDPTLMAQQQRVVRKLVEETNEFDNIYYEICNEPRYVTGGGRKGSGEDAVLMRDWQRALIQTVRDTEGTFPNRHLVVVNCHLEMPVRPAGVEQGLWVIRPDDGFYQRDAEVDLLNFHYLSHRQPQESQAHIMRGTWPAMAYHFGSIATFVAARGPGAKPTGFDEDFTGFIHKEPPRPHQTRMEAWESFVGGCIAYDHLDFTFTTDDPMGAAKGSTLTQLPKEWFDGRAIRRWFGYLAHYAAELDLATMHPDPLVVAYAPTGVGSVAARVQAFSGNGDAGGAGERVLVYLADQRAFSEGFGSDPVGGALWLAGMLAGRHYSVRTLNPRSAEWQSLPSLQADDAGCGRIDVSPFSEDALVEVSLSTAA